MNETGIIRRIADLIDHEHRIYLYLAAQDVIGEFQRQARSEGVRFGDGAEADERKLAPIMRLLDDGTICYVGFAGTMAYHSQQADILRVDYEKYMAGWENYIMKPPLLQRAAGGVHKVCIGDAPHRPAL